MPLKLNVGICKKIGQPDYGSLGASCNLAVELDQSLIFDDLDAFQKRVTHAYTACREAVTEELARQQQGTTSEHAANNRAASAAPPNRPANGQSNGQSSISLAKSRSTMPSNWPARFAGWVLADWRLWPTRCLASRLASCRV